jgi:bifunctional DNA-binding transcriptional regulator/antitoxin component of YhaV-PrlF toxin-antitoxin module
MWITYIYMVKTLISSKGQTTIPAAIRRRLKTSKIFWETNPDGSAIVRPAPDASALFGIAKDGKVKDPNEFKKAVGAIVKDANKKGPTL